MTNRILDLIRSEMLIQDRSISWIGRQAGISPQHAWRIIRGKAPRFSTVIADRMLIALGVEIVTDGAA